MTRPRLACTKSCSWLHAPFGRFHDLLKRMKRSVLSEPFNSRHSGAVLHDRQGQARVDAPSLDEHRARSALTVIAALLGTREANVLTQCIEQRRPRSDVELHRT